MRYIVLPIILIACAWTLSAQEMNYYKGKSVIETEQYEYSVTNVADRLFHLKNVKNKLFDTQKWIYKNSDKRVYHPDKLKLGVKPKDMNEIYDVFREVFSAEEILNMKAATEADVIYYDDNEGIKVIPVEKIAITIYSVVSRNGELLELQIIFPNIKIFSSIHPNKMYMLEQALKEKVNFEVPVATKELVDYILGLSVTVKVVDL